MVDQTEIEDAVHRALEALHDEYPDNAEAIERGVKAAYSDEPIMPKRKRGVKGTVGRPPIDKVALAAWTMVFVLLFLESVKPRRQSIRWACQETAKLGMRYVMTENNNPAPKYIKSWQTVMRYYQESRTLMNDDKFVHPGVNILSTLSYWLDVEPPYLNQELAEQWRRTNEFLQRDKEITRWDAPPFLFLPSGINLFIGSVNRMVYERLQRGMHNLNKGIMEALPTP
jgi:hypothetical protein